MMKLGSLKTIIMKITSESKNSPRNQCSHNDTEQVSVANCPPGVFCTLVFRVCSDLRYVCIYHGHEAAPARTDETTQDGKDTGLGPFQGWRRCPAGTERLREWVYSPGPAAGPVLPFPVLTDAIPSWSPRTAAAREWKFLPTQRAHSREEHNLRDLQAVALV